MWLYFLYMFKPWFSEEASVSFPSSWRQHNAAKVKIFPLRTGFLASSLAQDCAILSDQEWAQRWPQHWCYPGVPEPEWLMPFSPLKRQAERNKEKEWRGKRRREKREMGRTFACFFTSPSWTLLLIKVLLVEMACSLFCIYRILKGMVPVIIWDGPRRHVPSYWICLKKHPPFPR